METTGMSMEETKKGPMEELKQMREQFAKISAKGERFKIPRTGNSLVGMGKEDIDVILYRPAINACGVVKSMPVFFNMHGGAWIAGDAILMESFCQMMADEVGMLVVNVNYQKADQKPYPYSVEEVADAVIYFHEHAAQYGIDVSKMAVGGHSAGANLAAGAVLMLKEQGISLAAQVLVYPCTDMTSPALADLKQMLCSLMFPKRSEGGFAPEHRWASPLLAAEEELKDIAPAIFIECGPDELKPMGIAYAKRLIDVAVPVKIKEYPHAQHGFLEVNRPDYFMEDERKNPEQEGYCRDCERYLVEELKAYFHDEI